MNFESYTIFFILLIILLNLFLLSNLKWISKKIDVFDNPDNYRKIHTVPTPLLGGLFILTNLIFYCIFFIFLDVSEIKNSFHISEDSTIIFFLIISLIIFLIGFYDDAFLISSKSRIFILTTLVYFTVWLIDIIHINEVNFLFTENNLKFNRLNIFFPTFCLIILMISCNLYDGINFQSFLFYFINFSFLFFLSQNILILTIIISLIFFGYSNYKGKIFLGDSGVYLLSFLLGYFFIISFNIQFKILYADQVFLFLLFPVLDSFRVFAFRIIKNKDIFIPDQNHFHHFIKKKNGSNKSILILMYFNLIPVFSYYFSFNPAYVSIFLIINYFIILYFSGAIKP